MINLILFIAAVRSRCGHYIFAVVSSSYVFSSPNLSGRRLDVYHTSTHGMALVNILNAGLKCAAHGSLEMQDSRSRHLGPSYNFVELYLRI